ncbi:MAG: hypothetical protein ACK55I_48070, partial [bacterium]
MSRSTGAPRRRDLGRAGDSLDRDTGMTVASGLIHERPRRRHHCIGFHQDPEVREPSAARWFSQPRGRGVELLRPHAPDGGRWRRFPGQIHPPVPKARHLPE